jgi:hypothetical protein
VTEGEEEKREGGEVDLAVASANNGDKESRRRWGEKTVVADAVFSSLYRGM